MSVSDLFAENKLVKVCAPMVRYSKLEFRKLVRKYGCDLCFTPMIMADSFIKSEKARKNEFTTDSSDKPLIVQFAASNPNDFCEAAKLVYPYCSGVDLNCGCPQRWAMKLGIGAHLLSEPETIKRIILCMKNQISSDYSLSVKLRLMEDSKANVDLCKKLESAGVTFLTVHGRTVEQRCQPVNTDFIRDIALSLQIPLIANGDVRTLQDAEKLQELTMCKGLQRPFLFWKPVIARVFTHILQPITGVMSARGLLQNPALFQGYNKTPIECVREWTQIAIDSRLHFMTFHHHLVFMLEKILKKCYRVQFNNLTNYPNVISFLNTFFDFKLTYDLSDFPMKQAKDEGRYFKEKAAYPSSEDCFLRDIIRLYE